VIKEAQVSDHEELLLVQEKWERNLMAEERKRILIVDDDKNICDSLGLILGARGYEVDIAHTGKEAVEKSKKSTYSLAVLDIRLPDTSGTKLLKEMRDTKPRMVKIMLTGFPELQNAVDALNEGADVYFIKPIDPAKLLKAIEDKLEEQEED
jgi:DNA-binding response OmpR family regulator